MAILRRKAEAEIRQYLTQKPSKMLVVDGARQVGKSYIIRQLGRELFTNFIEVNMEQDRQGDRLFAEANTVESFYFALSAVAGRKIGHRDNTLVFIDEIQSYDHLLTLIKFLVDDGRFTYIASGSLLGVTLKQTTSIPVGSIRIMHMYPLDFEEFLWANGVGTDFIGDMRTKFENEESLPEAAHEKVMDLFRRYLLVGGLPAAVDAYVTEHNIVKVRDMQRDIMDLYKIDASKYQDDSKRKLSIRRIYDMIPSNMENRRKRMMINKIEDAKGKRTSDYQEEFDYLVSSGIALEVDAISKPTYPLVQNAGKNLLKLYLNDIGLLTRILYGNNILPVLNDMRSINLGSVYESVVAQELRAHGFNLFYYDNKKIGEVDYLIDDTLSLSVLPLEVKSGKDYKVHSALNRFLATPDYNIGKAYVLSNERKVFTESGITYVPVYDVMFFKYDIDIPVEQQWF